jgi:hypothetical protein
MHRAALTACVPWLAALAICILLAYFLVRLSRGRLQLARLRQLHRDEGGGVQSLSFVLTLPIFIMVMMLIVQISQLMIGIMVVHYAAFAAVRAAIVWIPADLSSAGEPANCISRYIPDPEAENVFPILPHPWIPYPGRYVPYYSETGPIDGGVTYIVEPSGPKYSKIYSAAVLATMPISPSRDVGCTLENSPPLGETSAIDANAILQEAYFSMSPSSGDLPAAPGRLRNKLAYSLSNTSLEIRFYHQNDEPPLRISQDGVFWGYYELEPIPYEFASNELGRQDLVTVKVIYNLALLPGPGRLLARPAASSNGQPDQVSASIRQNGSVYYYPLTASAALNVEGEKSVISYAY